jgi:hypothetical protein
VPAMNIVARIMSIAAFLFGSKKFILLYMKDLL